VVQKCRSLSVLFNLDTTVVLALGVGPVRLLLDLSRKASWFFVDDHVRSQLVVKAPAVKCLSVDVDIVGNLN
jgi:hypothetical protein